MLNSIISSSLESINNHREKKLAPFSMEELKKVIEVQDQLDVLVDALELTENKIVQNEVNIAHISGDVIPENVEITAGELVTPVGDVVPTISPGNDLVNKVNSEIEDQNSTILANTAGQLGYLNVDELKNDLGCNNETVSCESIRISPLRSLKAHNEGMKEFFAKIWEKIKEAFKWLMENIKDIGHKMLQAWETLFDHKKEIHAGLMKLKEASKLRLKQDKFLKDSSVITLATNIEQNLNHAAMMSYGYIAPFFLKFRDKNVMTDGLKNEEYANFIKQIEEQSSKPIGETVFEHLGLKEMTKGFIMVTRPNQILCSVVEDDIWFCEPVTIELNQEINQKFHKELKLEQSVESCIKWLEHLDKIKEISKKLQEDFFKSSSEEVKWFDRVALFEDKGDNKKVFKCMLKGLIRFRSGVIFGMNFIPRAILSLGKDLIDKCEPIHPDQK